MTATDHARVRRLLTMASQIIETYRWMSVYRQSVVEAVEALIDRAEMIIEGRA